MYHEQVGFIPGLQGWFNIKTKQKSMWSIIYTKRLKKNHITNWCKVSDKIQHPFKIKTHTKKSSNRGELPQLGKERKKPKASIVLNGKTECY